MNELGKCHDKFLQDIKHKRREICMMNSISISHGNPHIEKRKQCTQLIEEKSDSLRAEWESRKGR